MAKQVINNLESALQVRTKINSNFTELYNNVNNKVDKVEGKSLIDDYEIARLSALDTGNKLTISALEKAKLTSLQNYTLPIANNTTLGGVKSGLVLIVDANGNVTIADNSHLHTISNISGLQTALNNKAETSNVYDKSTIDNKISSVVTSLVWKQNVSIFADLTTTYPNAQNGWVVSVDEDGKIYRYNGTSWTSIMAQVIPLASLLVNGLLSSNDYAKLQNIADNATKVEISTTNGGLKINGVEIQVYTHPSTHSADMIVDGTVNKVFTSNEKTKLAGLSNFSGEASDVNIDTTTFNKNLTSNENTVQKLANKVDQLNLGTTVDLSGYYNKTEIDNSFNTLKDGVSTDGNTLAKLRNLISGIQTLLSSNDVNLDSLQEIVSYIKNNKSLIDGITTNKINTSDIIDDLIHTDTNKPLSANQGKVLKDLLDVLASVVSNIITNGDGSQFLSNDGTYKTVSGGSFSGDASDITTGTLNDARLSSNVTLSGNTFNTANNLLKLDNQGKLPTLDGSNLTNLPATTTSISQPSGSPVSIAQNQEIKLTHASVNNEKILIQILEQVLSSTITDNTIDFSTRSNYIEQDNINGTDFANGVASLKGSNGGIDAYTKTMLHMDGVNNSTTFTDTIGHTFTANGNAKISTSQSVFGGASGVFDGTNSYITTVSSNDYNLSNSNFCIDLRIKLASATISSVQALFGQCNASGLSLSYRVTLGTDNKITFTYTTNGSASTNLVSTSTISDTNWHHLEFSRTSNTLYMFIDGNLAGSISTSDTIYSSSNNFSIARQGEYAGWYFNGYIDEFRFRNGVGGHTTNFTPPTLVYSSSSYSTTPYYLKNNAFIDLLPINKINSITVTQTTPTNTSIKYLITFDNGQNWLYHDETGWHIYVTSGNSIPTTVWLSSNTYAELQTYFTNKTISDLTTELSSLSIVPVSLGFAWQLATTDNTATPSLDLISISMDTNTHYEIASIGKYGSTNSDYTIRRVNSATTYVKKISSGSTNIIPNLIIG